MQADIPEFDLPAGRVVGRVGENAALEDLHQHPLRSAIDANPNPVGLGDRKTGNEEKRCEELGMAVAPVFVDQSLTIEELPERAGDGVVRLGNVVGSGDSAGPVLCHPAVPVDDGSDLAADRERWLVEKGAETGVGGSSGIVEVTGDRDGGWCVVFEAIVAHLHVPGDEFPRQEPGGDEPGSVAIAVRVVDLHPCLVEVLHEALAVPVGFVASTGPR